jgi:hypothetical protein
MPSWLCRLVVNEVSHVSRETPAAMRCASEMSENIYELTCIKRYLLLLWFVGGDDGLHWPRGPRFTRQRGNKHRVRREGTNVESPRESAQLPDGNRASLEEIERWNTGNERPGLNEWSGRFWLPDGHQVEPARKCGMIRSDGRTGEMTLVQFDYWGPRGT